MGFPIATPATPSTSHFDDEFEAATRGWYVAPDGVCPMALDPETCEYLRPVSYDVCALVAILRDATPCLCGTRHVVWPRWCETMAHWLSLYEADRDDWLDARRSL